MSSFAISRAITRWIWSAASRSRADSRRRHPAVKRGSVSTPIGDAGETGESAMFVGRRAAALAQTAAANQDAPPPTGFWEHGAKREAAKTREPFAILDFAPDLVGGVLPCRPAPVPEREWLSLAALCHRRAQLALLSRERLSTRARSS